MNRHNKRAHNQQEDKQEERGARQTLAATYKRRIL